VASARLGEVVICIGDGRRSCSTDEGAPIQWDRTPDTPVKDHTDFGGNIASSIKCALITVLKDIIVKYIMSAINPMMNYLSQYNSCARNCVFLIFLYENTGEYYTHPIWKNREL
jgi:hypothetical protein